MRQMSKPRLANQSGIDASGSPGICRSKPCEPMDEPWTSRIVAFAGPETERFSAMNSFLPFDWVQCSWLGTERVVTALRRLPADYRVLCTLYFMADLSYEEIARVMECPLGTVRARLHRARKMLQKSLWRIAEADGMAGRPGGTA